MEMGKYCYCNCFLFCTGTQCTWWWPLFACEVIPQCSADPFWLFLLHSAHGRYLVLLYNDKHDSSQSYCSLWLNILKTPGELKRGIPVIQWFTIVQWTLVETLSYSRESMYLVGSIDEYIKCCGLTLVLKFM